MNKIPVLFGVEPIKRTRQKVRKTKTVPRKAPKRKKSCPHNDVQLKTDGSKFFVQCDCGKRGRSYVNRNKAVALWEEENDAKGSVPIPKATRKPGIKLPAALIKKLVSLYRARFRKMFPSAEIERIEYRGGKKHRIILEAVFPDQSKNVQVIVFHPGAAQVRQAEEALDTIAHIKRVSHQDLIDEGVGVGKPYRG